MKLIIKIMCLSIFLFCVGCSNVTLTKQESQTIKNYIQYSNNLIETILPESGQAPRKRLQPYRARYRNVQNIINQKF